MIYRYARSKILRVTDRKQTEKRKCSPDIEELSSETILMSVKCTFQPYIIQQILGQTKHKELLRSTSNANYTTIHLENA